MAQSSGWSKSNDIPGLIGRKLVDRSLFMWGLVVPQSLYGEFALANGGRLPQRGERLPISLVLEGNTYNATLVSEDRAGIARDIIHIRYDSNQALKGLLKDRLQPSFVYLESERESRQQQSGKRVHARLPDDLAAYVEFYFTEVPFSYHIEIIPTTTIIDEAMRQALSSTGEPRLEHMLTGADDHEFMEWAQQVGGQAGVRVREGLIKERKYRTSVNSRLRKGQVRIVL